MNRAYQSKYVFLSFFPSLAHINRTPSDRKMDTGARTLTCNTTSTTMATTHCNKEEIFWPTKQRFLVVTAVQLDKVQNLKSCSAKCLPNFSKHHNVLQQVTRTLSFNFNTYSPSITQLPSIWKFCTRHQWCKKNCLSNKQPPSSHWYSVTGGATISFQVHHYSSLSFF